MNDCFVIRNQDGHYWSKNLGWIDGLCPDQVANWKYIDEALNTLFELGSKDTDLRGEVTRTAMKNNKPEGLEISNLSAPELTSSSRHLKNSEEIPTSREVAERESLE